MQEWLLRHVPDNPTHRRGQPGCCCVLPVQLHQHTAGLSIQTDWQTSHALVCSSVRGCIICFHLQTLSLQLLRVGAFSHISESIKFLPWMWAFFLTEQWEREDRWEIELGDGMMIQSELDVASCYFQPTKLEDYHVIQLPLTMIWKRKIFETPCQNRKTYF